MNTNALSVIDGEPANVLASFFVSRLQSIDQKLGSEYTKIRKGKTLPTGEDVEKREGLLGALAKVLLREGGGAVGRNYLTLYSEMFLFRVLLHKAVLLVPDLDEETRKQHEDVLAVLRASIEKETNKSNHAENVDEGAVGSGERDNDDTEAPVRAIEEAESAEAQQPPNATAVVSSDDDSSDDGGRRQLGRSTASKSRVGKAVEKRGGSRRKQKK